MSSLQENYEAALDVVQQMVDDKQASEHAIRSKLRQLRDVIEYEVMILDNNMERSVYQR